MGGTTSGRYPFEVPVRRNVPVLSPNSFLPIIASAYHVCAPLVHDTRHAGVEGTWNQAGDTWRLRFTIPVWLGGYTPTKRVRFLLHTSLRLPCPPSSLCWDEERGIVVVTSPLQRHCPQRARPSSCEHDAVRPAREGEDHGASVPSFGRGEVISKDGWLWRCAVERGWILSDPQLGPAESEAGWRGNSRGLIGRAASCAGQGPGLRAGFTAVSRVGAC